MPLFWPALGSVPVLVISLFGGLMVFPADHLQINLGLRHLHAQVFHGGRNDLRDRQVAKPLVIGRDDVPGRFFLAGLGKYVLERFGVVIPQLTFLVVALADLPVSRGIIKPLLEAFKLLFLADMQKELDDVGVVLPAQQLLKIVDQLIPFRPDLPWAPACAPAPPARLRNAND